MSKTTKQPITALDCALDYGTRGFHIFPVHRVLEGGACSCGNGKCSRIGKHPATKKGFNDATTDLARIRQWWTEAEYNIGFCPSLSGLVAMDIDVGLDKAGQRKVGDQSLAALVDRAGHPLPDTLTVITGSGGEHIYFSTALDIQKSEGRVGKDIDVRGYGGYVILPPSNHASGQQYRWKGGDSGKIAAELPDWLASLMVKKPTSPDVTVRRAAAPAPGIEQPDLQPDSPNDRLTHSQVRELLNAIPASQRDHWMMFGHVLRTIADWIGGEQKAFEVWDAWAATGDGYGGPEDQRYHWATFTEPTQHPIALLIGHARDNDWKPSEEFHRAGRQLRSEAARKALDSLPANASPEDLRPVLALIVKLPAMDQDGFLKELKAKTKISIGALRREMPMADETEDTDAGLIVAKQVLAEHYDGGRAGSSDSYVPSGRIGRLDLKGGCYTAYTVFRLVAEDLARRGLARTVSAHLRAGRQTVRDFLTERYGVLIGERQYFTPRGRTPDQADVVDFLRALRSATRRGHR